MRQTELREVVVTYCDVCGDEIVGSMTIFNQGQADEKHACHRWIAAEDTRCDLKLKQQLESEAVAGK